MFRLVPSSAVVAAVALSIAAAPIAMAADPFPSKPIRIVVPSAAGGGLDVTTRLVAKGMAVKLGQPIIIENKPGADSILGTRFVKESPADGYTIVAQTSTMSALPAVKLNPGFDPVKDFTGIGPILLAPLVMVVPNELGTRSATEFIAKAKTSKMSYASAGTSSTLNIAAAMFMYTNGLDLLHVPYKGAAAALPDVAGGRVSTLFATYTGVQSLLESKSVRALGVTGDKRLPPLPNVPTMLEQGIKMNYAIWIGLLVPTGTPKDVVQRLAEALRYANETKEVRDRIIADGSEPFSATPEDFNKYVAKDVADTAKLIADLKIPKE